MAEDQRAIEESLPEDENVYPAVPFALTKVDRVLFDSDTVTIGSTELKATLTPGHARGCTIWGLSTEEGDKKFNVIFPCSISVTGNVLVNNKTYPGIADDYYKTFNLLKHMPADIVLTNHP